MGSALIVMLKDDLERKEINDIIAAIKHLPGVVSVEEEEDDDSKSILSEVPSSPIIVAQTRVEETNGASAKLYAIIGRMSMAISPGGVTDASLFAYSSFN